MFGVVALCDDRGGLGGFRSCLGGCAGLVPDTPGGRPYRYPAEIISHCVWLYHRFPLSVREVEEMMLARGVLIAYVSDTRAGP
jgi:hypothetical protein